MQVSAWTAADWVASLVPKCQVPTWKTLHDQKEQQQQQKKVIKNLIEDIATVKQRQDATFKRNILRANKPKKKRELLEIKNIINKKLKRNYPSIKK